MAFLTNGAVNRVIVHAGVKALAESAGGVFFFVYLLKAGLSVEAGMVGVKDGPPQRCGRLVVPGWEGRAATA